MQSEPPNVDIAKDWIRNRSDETAIEKHGCRFDVKRAEHVCRFIEENLLLYEGRQYAGKPFELLPWQRDFLMRAFGWIIFDEEIKQWVRRFKKVQIFVPKKNGKTPLAAAIGLYLFLADGESGQKVYSVARDGKQAKIMHTHALTMLRQSPTLGALIGKGQNAVIQHYLNTGELIIHENQSRFGILCGDNAKSQEGLNGSTICDEIHVLGRELAERIEYMGISRDEPMQFRISTAGDDPESWGKEQFDYGEAVVRGDVDDVGFLHKSYAAMPGQSDAYYLDPETWKGCNPSLGHTIRLTEFAESCNRARKQGAAEWRNFQMYRLNVWQGGVGHWLNRAEWDTCARDFDEQWFCGKSVGIGLDLSAKRDFTSVAITARDPDDDEAFWLFPWIWATQHWIEQNDGVADFYAMAETGSLEIIPGKQIDLQFVHQRIDWIANNCDVLGLAYDPYHAVNTKIHCEDKYGWSEENGLLIPFAQTIRTFASPTGMFERLVINDGIRHPDNRCLNWMVGHCGVKTDPNLNKRPVKVDEKKKIDAIVAGIESLWVTSAHEPNIAGTFYEENELEWA